MLVVENGAGTSSRGMPIRTGFRTVPAGFGAVPVFGQVSLMIARDCAQEIA